MKLIISSPTKSKVYSNLKKITLPSLSGQIQILANHAEMFLLLQKTKIIFTDFKNNSKEIPLNSTSQCYIKNDKITVIV